MLESSTGHEFTQFLLVGPGQVHRRLDQFVAAALAPEWSRSQVGRMIKAGLIRVNGTPVRASCVVRPGDHVEIAYPGPREPTPVSQIGTAQLAAGSSPEVLFSDTEVLVVNKPAGMPVHPSPGHPHSTLADALTARFPELAAMVEADGLTRAGIVHRLDKDTSGVIVIARTPFARKALSEQFKDRSVSKVYLALARGIATQERFTVDRSLGRHPTERKRMSIRSRKPREALTEFFVLHRLKTAANPATLLKAVPHTGRTHQIRVHLAASGHPCLGDPLYGGGGHNSGWSRPGQALHALALTITHPRSGERLEFIATVPSDFAEFLKAAGLGIGASTIRQWLEAGRT